ncbi:conserved hypothetical protein [Gammaproteobacteria bacterium]
MYITTFDEAIKMGSERSFDTLQYANRLKAVGVPEKQAEVQAEIMAETIEDRLATKKDLELIKKDLELAKSELKRDIKELELKIEATKNELLIKLGSMIVSSLGALIVLMKLFKL